MNVQCRHSFHICIIIALRQVMYHEILHCVSNISRAAWIEFTLWLLKLIFHTSSLSVDCSLREKNKMKNLHSLNRKKNAVNQYFQSKPTSSSCSQVSMEITSAVYFVDEVKNMFNRCVRSCCARQKQLSCNIRKTTCRRWFQAKSKCSLKILLSQSSGLIIVNTKPDSWQTDLPTRSYLVSYI